MLFVFIPRVSLRLPWAMCLLGLQPTLPKSETLVYICSGVARAKPFGRFLFSRRLRRFCTDADRGGLIPQIAPRRGRCHRCRSGAACFSTDRADLHRCPFGALLVFPQIAQICTDARSGRFLFSTQIAPLAPRSKREFCYNVTCYMLQ